MTEEVLALAPSPVELKRTWVMMWLFNFGKMSWKMAVRRSYESYKWYLTFTAGSDACVCKNEPMFSWNSWDFPMQWCSRRSGSTLSWYFEVNLSGNFVMMRRRQVCLLSICVSCLINSSNPCTDILPFGVRCSSSPCQMSAEHGVTRTPVENLLAL